MSGDDTQPLRLGLLVCGTVRDEHLPRYGRYPDMFRRLFVRVAAPLELVEYAVHEGEFPAQPGECDAWLISGSRFSVYDDEAWIRQLADFVRALRQARTPTVGICFGHQMLGHALGGETRRAPQGWGIGRHDMELLETAPWMEAGAARYALFVSHQDQVVQLPPGARRLARNDHCENAMFVLDDCMLGHPGPSRVRCHLCARTRGHAPRGHR